MKYAVPVLILIVLAALAITCTRSVVLVPGGDSGVLGSDGGFSDLPADAHVRDAP